MIITCEQCSTQFQLDDSKIPERGARVRCSRCKHAFFIAHPQADSESADDLARRALLGDAGGEPDSESDWQFNEDPAPADAAREAVDDLLGRGGASPAGSVDLGEAPGAGDSFGDDLEDDPLGLRDPDPEPEPEPEPDPGDGAEPEGAESGDPLGEPRDWNLFDDEPPPPRASGPTPADATPAGGTVIGRIPLVSAGSLADTLPQERRIASEEDEPSRAALWLGHLANAAGWLATAALAAFAFHAALAPRAAGPAVWSDGPLGRGLETRTVEGHWVENTVAGPLYVVRSVLRNANAGATRVGAELRVTFFDAQGRPVPSESAVLGVATDAAALRERNPRDVRAALKASAHQLAATYLAPGRSLPLQAVIESVPDAASYFRLEALRVQAPPPVAATPTADAAVEATAASRLP